MQICLSRIALLLGSLLPLAVFGQSNELSILGGATVHSAQVDVLSAVSVSAGTSASVQVDYAYLLKDTRSGALSVELPAARVWKASVSVQPTRVAAGTSLFFFTPGVRYQFAPTSRISPYLTAGFGFGWFDAANLVVTGPVRVEVADGFKPAGGFGGGLKMRIGRVVALRAEVRDYVACGSHVSSRNYRVFQGGFGVHF